MTSIFKFLLNTTCIIVLFGFGFFPAKAQNYNSNYSIKFDYRAELMSTICYLAGYPEYQGCRIESYKKEVDVFFAAYKEHEAVKYAKKLRKRHSIGYNAPMAYSVYLTDSLIPGVPYEELHPGFDSRWNKKQYVHFSELLREFVNDTRCDTFFYQQFVKFGKKRKLIDDKIISFLDIDWFYTFYGKKYPNNVIILSLMNGENNYAARTIVKGIRSSYVFLGTSVNPLGNLRFGDGSLRVVIHEFSHSWCNQLVATYSKELESVGEKLYKVYCSVKHENSYNNWGTVMNETFTRASTLCYLKSKGFDIMYENAITNDKNKGFLWTDVLAERFLELNSTAKVFDSPDLYVNESIKVFNTYLKNSNHLTSNK